MAPPRRPEPPPLEVDDPRVVGAGIALWAIGLLVLGALDLTGTSIPGWWMWMCVVGIVLGGFGYRVVAKRQRRAQQREAGPA